MASLLPYPGEHPRRAKLLLTLRALNLVEDRDFWLVHNGSQWRLRWFDHTTAEQQTQGDKLVNAMLNS